MKDKYWLAYQLRSMFRGRTEEEIRWAFENALPFRTEKVQPEKKRVEEKKEKGVERSQHISCCSCEDVVSFG